jgi:hypothetical protein
LSEFAFRIFGPALEIRRIALELEEHLDGPFTIDPAPATFFDRLACLNPFGYSRDQNWSRGIFGNSRGLTAGNASKTYAYVVSTVLFRNCSINNSGLLMFAAFTSLWMRAMHPDTIASRYDAALTLVKPVGVALLGHENVDQMILSVPRWRAALSPPPFLPPSSATDAGPDAPAADSSVDCAALTDDSFVMVPTSPAASIAAPDSPTKDLVEIERLVAKLTAAKTLSAPVLPARRSVSFVPKRQDVAKPRFSLDLVVYRSAEA